MLCHAHFNPRTTVQEMEWNKICIHAPCCAIVRFHMDLVSVLSFSQIPAHLCLVRLMRTVYSGRLSPICMLNWKTEKVLLEAAESHVSGSFAHFIVLSLDASAFMKTLPPKFLTLRLSHKRESNGTNPFLLK